MKLAKTFATIDGAENLTGGLVIRNSTSVGVVGSGPYVAVSLVELVAQNDNFFFSGIELKIIDEDGLESDAALVSADKVEDAYVALDIAANYKFRTDRYESTQASITFNDIKLIVFNSEDRLLSAVEIENEICILSNQSDLLDIKRLIEIAINHNHTIPKN